MVLIHKFRFSLIHLVSDKVRMTCRPNRQRRMLYIITQMFAGRKVMGNRILHGYFHTTSLAQRFRYNGIGCVWVLGENYHRDTFNALPPILAKVLIFGDKMIDWYGHIPQTRYF